MLGAPPGPGLNCGAPGPGLGGGAAPGPGQGCAAQNVPGLGCGLAHAPEQLRRWEAQPPQQAQFPAHPQFPSTPQPLPAEACRGMATPQHPAAFAAMTAAAAAPAADTASAPSVASPAASSPTRPAFSQMDYSAAPGGSASPFFDGFGRAAACGAPDAGTGAATMSRPGSMTPPQAMSGSPGAPTLLPASPAKREHGDAFAMLGANLGGDVDLTVMAYAQWLSEMKQQASSARYNQQAELDVIRDAIGQNTSEIGEFKRHSSMVVKQLQAQVSELRAKLGDALSDLSQLTRQRQEAEQRTGHNLSGLRDDVQSQQTQLDTSRRTLAVHVDKLQADVTRVTSALQQLDGDVDSMRKALGSSQEQTVLKFGEVDQAMSMFHGSVASLRQDLADTKQDWSRGQDLLGQAISTMSQDLADFQKHTTTVTNKLQSDMHLADSHKQEDKDRLSRAEAQISGVATNLYHTANELIMLKSDASLLEASTSQAGSVSRQRSAGGSALPKPSASPPALAAGSGVVPAAEREPSQSACRMGQARLGPPNGAPSLQTGPLQGPSPQPVSPQPQPRQPPVGACGAQPMRPWHLSPGVSAAPPALRSPLTSVPGLTHSPFMHAAGPKAPFPGGVRPPGSPML